MPTPSGADDLANDLLESLTEGKDFTVPEVDLSDEMFDQPPSEGPLYTEVTPITVDDLTTGVVGGTGVFDKLMVSLVNHLKVEYAANRISGAEYTKAYIGVVGAALQTAQSFLLGKDQAYWQALLVQAQARAAEVAVVQARVELETAQVMLVRTQFEAATAEANYGLTKIKIANEDITYANLEKTGLQLTAQTAQVTGQTALIASQKTGVDYTNAEILPAQKNVLFEQYQAHRAQTADNRSEGGTVTGVLGKQKDLYTQQIESYQRDAETKVAKIMSDAWITQKTIDEGLLAPTVFTNAEIDEVFAVVRTNNGLGS